MSTWKSKYIIGKRDLLPIVFTELISHDEMARAMRWTNVIGAGFCYIEEGRYVCYGSSVSLGIHSRGQEDADILNDLLGADQV